MWVFAVHFPYFKIPSCETPRHARIEPSPRHTRATAIELTQATDNRLLPPT
jgi:hypothetical protein